MGVASVGVASVGDGFGRMDCWQGGVNTGENLVGLLTRSWIRGLKKLKTGRSCACFGGEQDLVEEQNRWFNRDVQ